MKLLIAATLSVVTFAAGAQASHGSDQLAVSLGVEPGAYSLPQLSLLKGLLSEDGNSFRIEEILAHPEGVRGDVVTEHRMELDPNTAGWQTLAQSLGVTPGQYSPSELVALVSAISGEDRTRIAFVQSGGSTHSGAEPGQVSPAASQLAQSLGVEPGLYSLDQLVQLKGLDESAENNSRIRQILENPDIG